MRYEDLGPDYYEHQAATRRKVTWHIRQIQAEGFDVTIAPREPGPAEDAHASSGAA
jgi:hypothetical protein